MSTKKKPKSGGKLPNQKVNSKNELYISLKDRWIAPLLFIFSFLLYANTLNHDYVLDDSFVITENDFVQKGIGGIADILSHNYFYGSNQLEDGLYRPLSVITFAIEHSLFGGSPFYSHLINVLLYALCGLLLFMVLHGFLGREKLHISLAASLIYLAHPIHTEVVANVKSRDELLLFLFLLAILWSQNKLLKKHKLPTMIASGFFFLLAMFTKESAITFVAISPLSLYFFNGRSLKTSLTHLLAFVPGLIIYFAMRIKVLGAILAFEGRDLKNVINNSLYATDSFSDQFATALFIMMKYFKLLIWPDPLSYDYSFNQIPIVSFSNLIVILALVLLGFSLFWIIRNFKSKGLEVYAILWFFISFSIVSNFIIRIGSTMAERFMFIPSLGFCLLLIYMTDKLIKQKADLGKRLILMQRPMFFTVILLITASFTGITVERNSAWENESILISKDIEKVPNNCRANQQYAKILLDKYEQNGKTETSLVQKAQNHLNTALSIYPDYGLAHYFLGLCYTYQKNSEKAINSYRSALAVNAKDRFALRQLCVELSLTQRTVEAIALIEKTGIGQLDGQILQDLGSYYIAEQEYDKAKALCFRLIEENPNDSISYFILAKSFSKTGEEVKAIKYFNICVEKGYRTASSYLEIGNIHMKAKEYETAIEAFDFALQQDAGFKSAYLYKGIVYYEMKAYDQAIRTYKEALSKDSNYATAYFNMGNSYLALRDGNMAIECYNDALKINPEYSKAKHNLNYVKENLHAFKNNSGI